jgi:hypothetical protein
MATKDFQKDRVYKWQHARFGNGYKFNDKPELSQAECEALVADIARCYGVAPPNLIFPEGYQAKQSFYTPLSKSITLYAWAQKRYLVIHEMAHYIHHVKGCGGTSHGENYFSIFSYLISQYCGYPLHEIFHKASQYGIVTSKVYPTFIEGATPNPALVSRYK